MGNKKSDKKIKLDRINVLRKQYDSFLEEDKRRKERNEYILGQLEKMRVTTSSALVLRHHVPTRLPKVPPAVFFDDENPVNMKQSEYEPHLTNNPQIQTLMPIRPPTSPGEELLREISKKYILIPKLDQRVIHEFPEENNTFDNENDWKSKYDILDQLKKNEKESVSERSLKTTKPVLNDNIESMITPNAELDSVKPGHGLNLNMIYNEVPEKDVPVNKTFSDDPANYENETEKHYVEFKQNHPDKNAYLDGGGAPVNIADNIKDDALYGYYPKDDTKYGIDSPHNYAPQYQEMQYQSSSPDSHPVYTQNQEPPANETQYVTRNDCNLQDNNDQHLDQSNLENTYKQNEFEDKGQNEIPEKYYYNEENYAINPENITEKIGINNEEAVVYQDHTNVEAAEYPTVIQSSEEFITASNIFVKHGVNVNSPEYDNSGIAVEETVASNDVNHTQNAAETEQVPYDGNYQQNTESPVVAENHADEAAAIEEFEQENSQMFSTEPVNETQDATAYNVEYTGEQANYDPNTENQYYEEQQQIEYAENAADLQAYDQNYEQQYGQQGYENQELSNEQQRQRYEQQQGYEQQPQPHQQEQGHDPQQQAYEQVFQQPDVEDQQQVPPEVCDQQLYYEQNTPGMPEIEKQLDQEQSFVVPTPPSEEPKPDPKLIIVAD